MNRMPWGALLTGTILSMIMTGCWSASTLATSNPFTPPQLSIHRLGASYWALAGAATGNPYALFAVVAVIYACCLFVSLRRRARGI